MSRGARIGLVVLAGAVAVAAFVVAKPDEGEREGEREQARTAQQRTGTAPGRPRTAAEAAPQPRVVRIAIGAGKPVGGVRRVTVTKGELVRIVVTSDVPDEIHLHGYDIERRVAPGRPARFAFRARLEGVFEMESHDGEAPVASLVVSPS